MGHSQHIITFTILLGMNCVMVGILWMVYALKPKMCHGYVFKQELVIIDTLFDTFYAIFPMIIVLVEQEEAQFMNAVAALQISQSLSFIAALVPMIFLCRKCWTSLWHSQREMRKTIYEYYRNLDMAEKELNHGHHLQPRLYPSCSVSFVSELKINTLPHRNHKKQYRIHRKPSLGPTNIIHQSIPKFNLVNSKFTKQWFQRGTQRDAYQEGKKETEPQMYILQNGGSQINKKHQRIVLLFGCLFIMSGCLLVSVLCSIMNDAIDFCVSWKDNKDLLIDHPELALWDYCEHKIYPFVYDDIRIPCNCRKFRYKLDENNVNLSKLVPFNKSMEGIMRKWDMMEKMD